MSPTFIMVASLVAQTVKRLSTTRETRLRALGWEDPLEKDMAVHSRTTAWKIPRKEEPCRLQSLGSQRVGHDWATSLYFYYTISPFQFLLLCFILKQFVCVWNLGFST